MECVDHIAALVALKSADLRFGLESHILEEMLELVMMELLDVDVCVIFGFGSKDVEAAIERGEMNMNTDNIRSYRKD